MRKFGYDNDIKLRDDLLPSTFKRSPDQVGYCIDFMIIFVLKNHMLLISWIQLLCDIQSLTYYVVCLFGEKKDAGH